MADYDFFDMTGLPFCEPEKSAQKINDAITQKLKELKSLLTNESQQIRRDDLNAQIKLLNDTKSAILTPECDKVIKDAYSDLVNKRTQEEIARLESTAKFMAIGGTKIITQAAIKKLQKDIKLSNGQISKIFSNLGFTVKKNGDVDLAALFPNQVKKIDESIAAICRMKDPNPRGADLSLVKDAYSFVAYLTGSPENADAFRFNSDTAELQKICDDYSKKNAAIGQEPIKTCAALAATVKVNVFNSDENRNKYDFYLKYKSPNLSQLFTSMKITPEPVLMESRFAEPCIKQIAEALDCNYDVAVAVYNKEGNCNYEPQRAVYYVKCHHCNSKNEYPTEADAIKINSCTNCKKPLYKRCAKCGNMVLESLEKCPHTNCGFVFAGAKMFSKHYSAAEAAVRSCDFDLARKYLLEAQKADPSEKHRIDQLSAKIDAEETRYKEPLNKLRTLISARMFFKAQEILPSIIQKYPNLNIADMEKNILETVKKANLAFASAQNLTASKKADMCLSILQYCADHQSSVNFLRATPPVASRNLIATPNNSGGFINISWAISEEQGVKYHLVRKNGKTPPASVNDGILLLEDSNSSNYCDSKVLPGEAYSYSLFISRMGVFSNPTTKFAVLYADIQNLRAVQNKSSIRLTWDTPQNSAGATVTRSSNGRETILSRSAHGSFEDFGIEYGVTYTYTISVNYADSVRSPGIRTVVTPFLIIDSFRIKALPIKGNTYKVSWDITQPNIDLRILVNNSVVRECTSSSSFADISLPAECFNTIKVMAHSGGTWLESENSVQVNSYSPCSIDKKRTEITEKAISTPKGTIYSTELKIRLDSPASSNVVGFYYAVRTAYCDSKWAKVDEIGNSQDISKISLTKYRAQDGIAFSASVTNEQAFYVSVFTIHNVNGREIVSEPKTAKVNRVAVADLFWKVSKSILSAPKLTINIVGNRPIERAPELVLCCCGEKEYITSPDDAKAVEIIHLPAKDLDEPQTNYTTVYELPKVNVKGVKFFLFELNPMRSEQFTLRWFQGFTGKV